MLSAAMTMPQHDDGVVIASMGTDGIDGMANTFFGELNDAFITGRTGTNVNDIVVMLVT